MKQGSFRILAPHFVAGGNFLEADNGAWKVTEAAPIIRYMVGWTMFSVKKYCDKKKWELEQ